ncbi:hypothetical protein Tco_1231250, partial [Tanacetum coccineum]
MVFHNEDGNPARANIKQALGSFKDGDGDGDTQELPAKVNKARDLRVLHSPPNNSFDMQQIAASLKDKMTIKMNKMLNEMKALVVITPAPIKAVEELCVTCGSNHNFNQCPLTRGGNDFPVFHDNIQQFQQTVAV